MRLYRTTAGPVVELDGRFHTLDDDWDDLFVRDHVAAHLRAASEGRAGEPELPGEVLPPVAAQEVWAAGVTYYRSREARIEESKGAGGGSFYDRVYEAERPELFFKAPGWRVRGPGAGIRVRRDATWNVPEPELALCLSSTGRIFGYTLGNDVSSRDIEGENPLYLPQAKVYDGACALGPGILVTNDPLPPETPIELRIQQGDQTVFEGGTTLSNMRRRPDELVAWLFRELTFPHGVVLLTGTGVIPGDDVRLRAGDEVEVRSPAIGRLVNRVES
jgi:2-dehydro-3-deoxy-D-arabinonate dehydratase